MEIKYGGSVYYFRECDVKGWTKEEVQTRAEKIGKVQYEPRAVWLVIPGVGYGLREDYWVRGI